MTLDPLLWLNRLFEIDPLALLTLVCGLTLAIWARRRVHSAYERGARLASKEPVTGGWAASEILRATELEALPEVELARGPFADYYDPTSRVVRLSPAVLHGQTLAAIGIAAHEVGHAIQHARRDPPLPLPVRDLLALVSRLATGSALIFMISGLVLVIPSLLHGGMILFGLNVLIQLAGLPIERDASRRAKRGLAMTALVESDQDEPLSAVLDAAVWEPVAATLPRIRTPAWRRIAPEAGMPRVERDGNGKPVRPLP